MAGYWGVETSFRGYASSFFGFPHIVGSMPNLRMRIETWLHSWRGGNYQAWVPFRPSTYFQAEPKEDGGRDRAVGFHFQEVGIVTNRAKNPVGEKTSTQQKIAEQKS